MWQTPNLDSADEENDDHEAESPRKVAVDKAVALEIFDKFHIPEEVRRAYFALKT